MKIFKRAASPRRRTRRQRARVASMVRLRRRLRHVGTGYILSALAIIGLVAAFALWRNPSIIAVNEAPVRFFQIATGAPSSTFFPVGRILAAAISNPPGAAPCLPDDRCGVPGLIAVVKASSGSVANMRGVNSGRVDSALAQADIARWAYRGQEMFRREGRLSKLRAISGLSPQAIQLVAREGAEIESLADLRGKRVSLDAPSSEMRAEAEMILKAFGIAPGDLVLAEVDSATSADMVQRGELDAFFTVSGAPSALVANLLLRGVAYLVAIDGEPLLELLRANPQIARYTIAAGTYQGVDEINTISVPALWVTSAETDPQLVEAITAALWNPGNRTLINAGQSKAHMVELETALDGVTIPLHEGARRFYETRGMKTDGAGE